MRCCDRSRSQGPGPHDPGLSKTGDHVPRHHHAARPRHRVSRLRSAAGPRLLNRRVQNRCPHRRARRLPQRAEKYSRPTLLPVAKPQGAPGRLARRLHRRRRARPLHRPHLPAASTGTAPRSSPSRPGTSSPRSCSSRRGSDFSADNACNLLASDDEWTVADHGRGRPRRPRLGDRLVQLHRPAQPDARRVQDRQGQRLRDAAPRDKKHGRIYRIVYTGGDSRRKPLDLSQGDARRARWRAEERQPVLADARPAAAGRAQDKAVIPDLVKLRRRPDGRRDRPERRRDPRPLDAARAWARSTAPNADALAAAVGALKHPSAGVRRNAVQVLPAGAPRRSQRSSTPTAGRSGRAGAADAAPRPSPTARRRRAPASGPAPPCYAAAAEAREPRRPLDPRRRRRRRREARRGVPPAVLGASAKENAGKPAAAAAGRRPAEAAAPKEPPEPDQERVDGRRAGRRPTGWRPSTYGGPGDVHVDTVGHTGGAQRQDHIRHRRGRGWSQDVALKPNTRYRLSAWVKTKGVAGDAKGALFNVHELQQSALPKPLKGDNDWTATRRRVLERRPTRASAQHALRRLGPGQGRGVVGRRATDRARPGRPPSPLAGPGSTARASSATSSSWSPATTPSAARSTRSSPRSRRSRAPNATLADSVLDGLVAGWPDRRDAARSSATPTSRRSPSWARRCRRTSATACWCSPSAGGRRRSSPGRWTT